MGMQSLIKGHSRKSDVRKAGLHEISQFLAQLNMFYLPANFSSTTFLFFFSVFFAGSAAIPTTDS